MCFIFVQLEEVKSAVSPQNVFHSLTKIFFVILAPKSLWLEEEPSLAMSLPLALRAIVFFPRSEDNMGSKTARIQPLTI